MRVSDQKLSLGNVMSKAARFRPWPHEGCGIRGMDAFQKCVVSIICRLTLEANERVAGMRYKGALTKMQ